MTQPFHPLPREPGATSRPGSGRETAGEPADAAATRPHAECLHCFLVEDSPLIRQHLIATLEEMLPLQVVATAEDEQEAVQWMRQCDGSCDLVVIDIFLRSGTGLEVLRNARQLQPHAKLVVLSNYATPDMRQRCLQLGADKVFDKSAEIEELIEYGERLARPGLN